MLIDGSCDGGSHHQISLKVHDSSIFVAKTYGSIAQVILHRVKPLQYGIPSNFFFVRDMTKIITPQSQPALQSLYAVTNAAPKVPKEKTQT